MTEQEMADVEARVKELRRQAEIEQAMSGSFERCEAAQKLDREADELDRKRMDAMEEGLRRSR